MGLVEADLGSWCACEHGNFLSIPSHAPLEDHLVDTHREPSALYCWILEILDCDLKGRRALLRVPSSVGRSVCLCWEHSKPQGSKGQERIRSKKNAASQDPTVGVCLWPCGSPRGGGYAHGPTVVLGEGLCLWPYGGRNGGARQPKGMMP